MTFPWHHPPLKNVGGGGGGGGGGPDKTSRIFCGHVIFGGISILVDKVE